MPTDNQRDAFEAYMRREHQANVFMLTIMPDGRYRDVWMNEDWALWQAALASAPAVEAPRDVVERVAKAIYMVGRDEEAGSKLWELVRKDGGLVYPNAIDEARAAIAALQPSATQTDEKQLTKPAENVSKPDASNADESAVEAFEWILRERAAEPDDVDFWEAANKIKAALAAMPNQKGDEAYHAGYAAGHEAGKIEGRNVPRNLATNEPISPIYAEGLRAGRIEGIEEVVATAIRGVRVYVRNEDMEGAGLMDIVDMVEEAICALIDKEGESHVSAT